MELGSIDTIETYVGCRECKEWPSLAVFRVSLCRDRKDDILHLSWSLSWLQSAPVRPEPKWRPWANTLCRAIALLVVQNGVDKCVGVVLFSKWTVWWSGWVASRLGLVQRTSKWRDMSKGRRHSGTRAFGRQSWPHPTDRRQPTMTLFPLRRFLQQKKIRLMTKSNCSLVIAILRGLIWTRLLRGRNRVRPIRMRRNGGEKETCYSVAAEVVSMFIALQRPLNNEKFRSTPAPVKSCWRKAAYRVTQGTASP